MPAEKYQIDSVDRRILRALQKNAREPFLEIARDLGVAGGTIHQRVERMRAAGIIVGSQFLVDPVKLGFGVTAMIGVHLSEAQAYPEIIRKVQKLANVLEAHYTTGTFAIILKVCARDIHDLYEFLTNKLQRIEGVRSTETFICLSTPVQRSVEP